MLYLDDWIVWDFWLAPRLGADEPFHCYFLQAPRSISHPEMRHDLARIGLATSENLVDWTYHGEIMSLGDPGSWDDMTQWTGSVTRHDGVAYLFYTGRTKTESGLVQRIGLAVSDDLRSWRKIDGNPVLEAASPWYIAPAPDGRTRSDCRDPWVLWNNDRWLMYYTASAPAEPWDARGVVGIATSDDLVRWSPGPPVVAPGVFEEVEVPQVFPLGDRWVLLFCTGKHATRNGRKATWNGTHYYLADSPFGPFTLAPEPLLQADEIGTNYAARAVLDPWFGNYLLAWHRFDDDGAFVGALTDPFPLYLDARNHRLTLESAR